MSTKFGLGMLFVLLALVGGLLLLGNVATAAPAATPKAIILPQDVTSTAATTLTLSVPDVPIGTGGEHARVDFWKHTTYDDDMAGLTYTVTQETWGSYLNYEIVDSRYFSMTSDTTLDKSVEFSVHATDGVLTATDAFVIEVSDRPEIDFFDPGLVQPLRDPVYAFGGKGLTSTIDLWYYAYDYEDDDWELDFYITNQPSSSIKFYGIVVSGSRYLDVVPPLDFYGTFPLEIMVEDTVGLTDTSTFTVTVLQEVFLPLVMRSYPPIPVLQPIDNPDGDGDYWLRWSMPTTDDFSYYQTEFSFNDPTFANGQTAMSSNAQQHGYYTWPGTHYWRVRPYFFDDDLGENVPGRWSNVESTTVGQFAYLMVENESYTFNMKIEISGNGLSDSITLSPQDYDYWHSVPVGSYNIRVISDYVTLCPGLSGDQRSEQIYLGNSIDQGAWYTIEQCETTGPTVVP